jgi:hypothetical protein
MKLWKVSVSSLLTSFFRTQRIWEHCWRFSEKLQDAWDQFCALPCCERMWMLKRRIFRERTIHSMRELEDKVFATLFNEEKNRWRVHSTKLLKRLPRVLQNASPCSQSFQHWVMIQDEQQMNWLLLCIREKSPAVQLWHIVKRKPSCRHYFVENWISCKMLNKHLLMKWQH